MDIFVKILITTVIWSLVILNFYILFNSKKFFRKLKKLELTCVERRRDLIHNYIPVMYALTQHSGNLNLALKDSTLKAFLYSAPEIVRSINACQNLGIKAGINLLKWLLE